jgi:hypothetical protein
MSYQDECVASIRESVKSVCREAHCEGLAEGYMVAERIMVTVLHWMKSNDQRPPLADIETRVRAELASLKSKL